VDESFLDHMKRVSRTRRTLAAVEVGDPISAALGGSGAQREAPERGLGEGEVGAADHLGSASVSALRDAAQAAVQVLVHRARAALASEDTPRYDAGFPSPSATGHGH
jgi:1-acyl-sn-glycerol-3-phosphate acyltransferase